MSNIRILTQRLNMKKFVLIFPILFAFSIYGQTDFNSLFPAIPNPDWEDDPTQPSLPSPWTSDQSGFYYVDPGQGGATDSGRTFGNPTAARLTIPTSLSPGDVVVLAGNYSSTYNVSSSGNASNRIWLIGDDPETRPRFSNIVDFDQNYWMVQNIHFAGVDGALRFNGSYITADNCLVTDTDEGFGSGVSGSGDHIVFKNGIVGPVGDYLYSGPDVDHHGWKLNSSFTWVYNSLFYRCQGDGIQVGDTGTVSAITDVYIFGNEAMENLQTGFWLKNCTRALIAYNEIHNHVDEDGGSVPAGTGGQYDFDIGVWAFNNIYNCKAGVQIQTSNSSIQGPRFVIGNTIHNTTGSTTSDPHLASAITSRMGNSENCYILFNTLYDNAGGINVPDGDATTVYGNIIELPTGTGVRNIYSSDGSSSSGTLDFNFYVGSTQRISWGTSTIRTLAEMVSATTQCDNGISNTSGGWVDADNDNFSLLVSSSAVDAGPSSKHSAISFLETEFGTDFSTDLNGTARPVNTNWDIGALEYTAGGDTDPPLVTSRTLLVSGTQIQLVTNESVQEGTGGDSGFSVSATGGAVSVSNVVAASTTIDLTLSRTVYSGETVTVTFTQSGDTIEDTSGNDLASFSNQPVTNNGPTQPASGSISVSGAMTTDTFITN